MSLQAAANQLLSSLFEPPCAGCRQRLRDPLDGAVCSDCWTSLSLAHPLHEHFPADHAISWACAVDHYDGRMKEIVHALKYDRRRTISTRLGALMRERGDALLCDADLVVPVPLHPRREYQRGFNQAEDLAGHLGLPVARLLRRARYTRSQIELPKHQRQENVKGAFVIDEPKGSSLQELLCAKGFPLRSACSDEPSGSSSLVVVLVDDVSTTGSTLDACARVLRSAGVREVRALTAARVDRARR